MSRPLTSAGYVFNRKWVRDSVFLYGRWCRWDGPPTGLENQVLLTGMGFDSSVFRQILSSVMAAPRSPKPLVRVRVSWGMPMLHKNNKSKNSSWQKVLRVLYSIHRLRNQDIAKGCRREEHLSPLRNSGKALEELGHLGGATIVH